MLCNPGYFLTLWIWSCRHLHRSPHGWFAVTPVRPLEFPLPTGIRSGRIWMVVLVVVLAHRE